MGPEVDTLALSGSMKIKKVFAGDCGDWITNIDLSCVRRTL